MSPGYKRADKPFIFLGRTSLTIALQEYKIVKNDAKKNPVEKTQRDVYNKILGCVQYIFGIVIFLPVAETESNIVRCNVKLVFKHAFECI